MTFDPLQIINASGEADAEDVQDLLLRMRGELNSLTDANFLAQSLGGGVFKTGFVVARIIKRNAFGGTKLKSNPGELTAAHFKKVGHGSGLDADTVDGLHATDIREPIALRVVNVTEFTQLGSGAWDLGTKELLFVPSDFGLTVFPDPVTEPWDVGVELSASIPQSAGETATGGSSPGGVPALPRSGAPFVCKKATTGFSIILSGLMDLDADPVKLQQFWNGTAMVDELTVTVCLTRKRP